MEAKSIGGRLRDEPKERLFRRLGSREGGGGGGGHWSMEEKEI